MLFFNKKRTMLGDMIILLWQISSANLAHHSVLFSIILILIITVLTLHATVLTFSLYVLCTPQCSPYQCTHLDHLTILFSMLITELTLSLSSLSSPQCSPYHCTCHAQYSAHLTVVLTLFKQCLPCSPLIILPLSGWHKPSYVAFGCSVLRVGKLCNP